MTLLHLIIIFILGIWLGSITARIGRKLAVSYTEVGNAERCKRWFPALLSRNGSRLQIGLELAGGVLTTFSIWWFVGSLEWIVALCLITMLLIIFVTDLLVMIIPNRVLLIFLPIFVVLRLFLELDPWWSPFAGALIGSGLLLVIMLVSRGGMGAGDMKLFGVLGIVLGWQLVLLAFFLSCLLGAIIGIILQILGKTARGQAIPFGPYIVAASLLTYFFGDTLLSWYLQFL